jgi:predicted acylesterase/phospholipase RssA
LPLLRIFAGFAVCLMVWALASALPPAPWASAYAQTRKGEKKGPLPKEVAKKEHERTPFTVEDAKVALIPGIDDARVWGDSAADFSRLLPPNGGPWLAISGGGSDGAFGGGVLVGWTQSGNRPEFAVVTGVSIGSLLAPHAFLGPRYDEEVRKNFTTINAADIFEDRISRDSLLDYWPLKGQIEQQVSKKLLAEIAAEHARGRRLFIVTTNLDSERRVVWNMGAIATAGDDRALKLFRDILLASCAIPGFFSPVAIEAQANGKRIEELHGDGTLTAPFFVVPEAMLQAGVSSRAPIDQLYVIINSKLTPEFSMTPPTITGTLGRSIGTALTAALRTQIMLVSAAAQRQEFPLRVAHVDSAFNFPLRGPFDGKYMQALFEAGVAAGKNGTAFAQTPPGVSIRGSASGR